MAKVRIIISRTDQQILIDAPYDVTERRQQLLRSLGCVWNRKRRCWTFDDPALDFWATEIAWALHGIGDTTAVWSRHRSAVRR